MRAYFFGNMYLRSIQQGIQAQHATAEMFVKYNEHSSQEQFNILHDWAENHKTSILLNAGYSEVIRTLIARFESPENPYPWSEFYESQEAADGLLTTVGIILPEKIYESAAFLRSLPFRKKEQVLDLVKDIGRIDIPHTEDLGITTHELSKWEFDFVQELNNYGMAS